MHYLIIGNSIASVGCIEAIRKLDTANPITVIGEERYACYARPLISYLLQGKTDEQRMVYRSLSFYAENNVTVRTGVKAIGLDAGKKTVTLSDGSIVTYDKLLVATGSSPFIPPMKNLELVKKYFTFMQLDDAKQLEEAIHKESRVLILGAGLIGLKCAEGLHGRVKSITIVDLAPRILPSVLDEPGSARIQEHLEAEGLHFILSDSVREFTNDEALLSSGRVLGFDVLVVAVGVRPNTHLVKEAGGEVNRGIVVDRSGKTSLDSVYSAGDCTEGYELISGNRKVLALLPNAFLQGETAGRQMAGDREAVFDNAIAMNALSLFGLHVITAGSYEGQDLEIPCQNGYKRLFVKDNHLVGYILMGEAVNRAGIYTSLIRNRTDLDTVDFALISEQPVLMAFAKTVRKQKLGGSV
ncbi:MAG: NAD(P)/FAD-dependent oxidoreductase [Sphaerochaeta sp.]|jgi:NAD(P)H-nitrite reductase large subunit|uniref:NAD(P)/FAD-dependent oxidoreductase n=1 Tax=Sphaerochaeta sp. TaxID=1972642 RepID=UPI002FCAECAF